MLGSPSFSTLFTPLPGFPSALSVSTTAAVTGWHTTLAPECTEDVSSKSKDRDASAPAGGGVGALSLARQVGMTVESLE